MKRFERKESVFVQQPLYKKIYIVIISIVIFSSFFIAVMINLSNIKIWYNSVFPLENIETLNLTYEQKIVDFDYLCYVLENGMPVLSVLKNECNFDYYFIKESYRKNIENTENDFEFYCLVNSFLNTIPSAHTFLCTPSYSNYESLNCSNSNNVLAVRGLKQYSDYWNELINKYTDSLKCSEVYCAAYNFSDGGYYFNNGDSIISINNISVDEYIIETPMIYSLRFDDINKKLYRENIFFSSVNIGGEKHDLIVKSSDEKIETTLYGGGYNDYCIVLSESNKSEHDDELLDIEDFSFIEDDNNQLLYANISNLNYDNSKQIKENLENRKYNTVVLDIRDNHGGVPQLFLDNIYTPLIKDDKAVQFKWYTPETEINKKNVFFYNPLYCTYARIRDGVKYTDITSLPDMNAEYVENEYSYLCTGNHKKNADIFLLTSSRTASAADKLTSILKQTVATTVIGNSTAGEGTGSTPAADILPNSYLVFVYYPSIAYNMDGSNNTIRGTSPNYFTYEYDIEQMNIMKDLYNKDENPYTYENRLKWDDVLIKTLEIIKEDENDQTNNTPDE